ncbi:MAG: peptide chain release factor 1 [Kiritimatiellia bacterium]|jgi:peptide chain release factor 1|nr:peptide chain release factor 1 [Kiritimatiellia bacterium]MDP6630841.1 peptide chain release factor 1 [Kiritimatiellia bacterium]MDP6811280.1 peptide chain release factor 1 [Kiritimatiellia bacterium]MDP7024106.1 peptide chain release factor 1 [Kiritimatiellia bacterium]
MINNEHIERMLARIPEIETELSQPETVSNQNRYRELLREHSGLKKLEGKAGHFQSISTEMAGNRELLDDPELDPELREMAEAELARLEPQLPEAEKELMVALLPEDPDEDRNAIVEVRAGTGGDEAALFAGDLFRMYSRFAEAQGWKIGVIDASTSDMGGYKEVVFKVEGSGAFGAMTYESGGHRVQRVPVTESQGRIHTSAATVAVFPEAEPQDDIELPPDEVRIDIFRSSGPGGQSVNTTDSAVRLTHIPTGITVQCQDEKSQHRNREKAMAVLKSRILDMRRREEAEKKGDARRTLIGSGDRSQRIRTYNFPQNRLTDHRVNLALYSLDRIMEGDLTALVDALRQHDVELRLEELGTE